MPISARRASSAIDSGFIPNCADSFNSQLSTSSFPISHVHPDANAKRKHAMAKVVLPTHVIPACNATHHESAGAL